MCLSPPSTSRPAITYRPIFGRARPTTIQLGAFWPIIFGAQPEHPAHPHSADHSIKPLRIDVDLRHPALTSFPDGLTPSRKSRCMSMLGPDFTIFPNGYTIDPIPLQLNPRPHPRPRSHPHDLPAVPGFGNMTGSPSSGFFNSGAGCQGLGNVGAMVSVAGIRLRRRCWVNVCVFNAGTLHSGVLEFRLWHRGCSTPACWGYAPALVSGLGSVGQQLSIAMKRDGAASGLVLLVGPM